MTMQAWWWECGIGDFGWNASTIYRGELCSGARGHPHRAAVEIAMVWQDEGQPSRPSMVLPSSTNFMGRP